MLLVKNQANCFYLKQAGQPAGQAGWKYYNTNIRKKAMEQEFSWSGLLTNLSIAFFMVILSASALNFINRSIAADSASQKNINKNVYYLENNLYLSNNFNQRMEAVSELA